MTEDELRAAIDTYDTAITNARQERDAAIARARAEGMKQKDVVRVTGYSRELIRQIERTAE